MPTSFKLGTRLLWAILLNLFLITEYSRADLIMAYSFDNSTVSGNTIVDVSGTYTGTFTANVAPGQAGLFGQSFYFDGTNNASEVKIPYTTAPKFGNNFTFAVRMKYAAADANRASYLLHRGTLSDDQNSIIFGFSGPGEMEIFGPQRTGADPRPVSKISSIPADTWNHVAYTYDGATLRSYLNGVQTSSSAIVFDLTATGDMYLGSSGNGFNATSNNFRGFLDDVGFWNEALSASEILALSNAPLSVVPEPGSIAMLTAICLSSVSFRRLKRRNKGIPHSDI